MNYFPITKRNWRKGGKFRCQNMKRKKKIFFFIPSIFFFFILLKKKKKLTEQNSSFKIKKMIDFTHEKPNGFTILIKKKKGD